MCLQFRVVAANDFAKKMAWPELIPAFKTAIQSSDLVNGTGVSDFKTLNVLLGLQTIIKPYQVALSLFLHLCYPSPLSFIFVRFIWTESLNVLCSILWIQQSLENLYRNSWSLSRKSYWRLYMLFSIILSNRYLNHRVSLELLR